MKITTPKTKSSPSISLALALLALTVLQTRAQSIYTPYAFTNFAGDPTFPGSANGNGASATFNDPAGIGIDSAGNIYVAGYGDNTIRKIDTAGNVTSVAGNANAPAGHADGNGSAATFNHPIGTIAVDSAGNLYVADIGNNTIRKIDTAANVTTLAGNPNVPAGSANGNGSAATFNSPNGVAVDSAGNLYVSDFANWTIRKIDTAGNVTTLAGTPGVHGSTDGPGSTALFYYPSALSIDSAGNLYVADYYNYTIRKIDTAANVTTLAGSPGNSGSADGNGSAARFYEPNSVAVDNAGNIYITDEANMTMRKLDSAGNVTTLAGVPEVVGHTDGVGSGALFYYPYCVGVDSSGSLYVADLYNDRVTKGILSPAPTLSVTYNLTPYGFTNFAGQPGTAGFANGQGSAAQFDYPSGMALDSAGNIFVGDVDGEGIRRIDTAGNVTTLAGGHGNYGYTNAQGAAAAFFYPIGVAVDSADNVYVADQQNNAIRKVDTAGNVITWAGGGPSVQGANNANGTSASFYFPTGVAVDSAGNVYVAEFANDDIRKIDSAQNVTTLAGLAGTPGTANGSGTAAQFQNPTGVAVDSAGNVYVADQGNDAIRIIDPSGRVNTLAGGDLPSAYGYLDANGTLARFDSPNSVAVDSAGNVFVTDALNYLIRKIDTDLNVTTLAGSPGNAGTSDGVEYMARFNQPSGIAVNSAGVLYVADEYNHRITRGAIAPPVLILNWPGGGPLQSSVNAAGPYVDVPGALNGPVQVSPTGPQNFYRVRR